jgi:hypothetical protein
MLARQIDAELDRRRALPGALRRRRRGGAAMTGRWYLPVDPECPVVADYTSRLLDDPMSEHAPVDEILEAFENRHARECERCLEYGLANVEMV